MPKGFPKIGLRAPAKRWNGIILAPLYRRWLAGEDLRNLAKANGTTFGRLRTAFIYFGFDMSGLAHPGRVPKIGGGGDPLAGLRQATRSEFEPTPRPYDADEHRRRRHYQGSFDL